MRKKSSCAASNRCAMVVHEPAQSRFWPPRAAYPITLASGRVTRSYRDATSRPGRISGICRADSCTPQRFQCQITLEHKVFSVCCGATATVPPHDTVPHSATASMQHGLVHSVAVPPYVTVPVGYSVTMLWRDAMKPNVQIIVQHTESGGITVSKASLVKPVLELLTHANAHGPILWV